MNDYGESVYSNARFRIRVKADTNGDLEVVIHKLEDGKEMRPLGYLIGANMLMTKDYL